MPDDIVAGEGWAATSLNELGDGPGFRKIRKALGVTAFGINAIVLPSGVSTGFHWHDRQEETYFVHAGAIELEFGEEGGPRHRLDPGGIARVDAATPRRISSVGDQDAVYVIVGGADGYVGRDGRAPDDEPRVRT